MPNYEEFERWVLKQIADIALGVDDNEVAHSTEDYLHQQVLGMIVSGGFTQAQCEILAALALSTKGIKYTRWYA